MIVFDLDKTLRDTTGSELHVPEDITLAKNWVKWQEWVNANGTPITKMVELYVKMNKRADTLILTSSQFGTLDWLTANDIPAPNNIIERDAGDNRHGFDYKREFIDSNLDDIELWVDDDKAVCNYALSLGVRVMLVDAKAYSPDEPKERGIVIMDTKHKIALTTALMALDLSVTEATKAQNEFNLAICPVDRPSRHFSPRSNKSDRKRNRANRWNGAKH